MIEVEQALEVVISAERLHTRVCELAAQISRDFRDKNPVILGTLKGGFLFIADLVRQLDFDLEIDFISARSYLDSTTSSGKVDLFKKLSIDMENRRLLIVEDVVDTGLTLRRLVENLQAAGPASVDIVALIVKESAQPLDIEIKYVGFEMDERFLVGYGMDLAEKYRNLPYIAWLKDVK
ncbi:MAG: hypoxanthine phosphoribosyltransferase [bacterium]